MQSTHEDSVGNEHSPSDNNPQDQCETLKYHLLGPSLTKAGQDAVDQQKVQNGLDCLDPTN